MQQADGSINMTDDLATALGVKDVASLQLTCGAVFTALGGSVTLQTTGYVVTSGSGIDQMVATILVLSVLEHYYTASRNVWALFARRSSGWLSKAAMVSGISAAAIANATRTAKGLMTM